MSFILNSGRFGAAVDPGLTLLQSATLWLNAGDPGSDSQKIANRGTGGTALDARLGSTTGVDTNDPLLLPHTGTNYLYLPGISGNFASAPDIAAYTSASEMEIIMRVQFADYTPPTDTALMCHDANFDDGWTFGVLPAGTLQWRFGSTYTSTVAAPFTDGTAYWVRATWKVSDFARFYYAADQSAVPSSWTQIGTDVATSGTLPPNSTTTLKVGGPAGPSTHPGMPTGSIFRAIFRTTISGSAVFDADFSTNTGQSTFTESSSNAATVTINRATSGRKAVMVVRPTLLFGTDDYLEVADNALLDFAAGESLTAMVCMRQWPTPTFYGNRLAKTASGTAAGYSLFNETTTNDNNDSIADGTNQVFASGNKVAYTSGALVLASTVRNVVADTLTAFTNSTAGTAATDTTTGSLANANPLFVGRSSSGTPRYSDMEITHVAVFRSALTSTELGQIATYLGV